MKYIIDMLHKDTGLPIDYLIEEQKLCSDSTLKNDCKNFIHWDLKLHAYSECTHYNNWFIYMEKDCCKDCQFYESRLM